MKNILLLSGGLDSTVLLAQEKSCGRLPDMCLSFDYGQKHGKELKAAEAIAKYYQAEWACVKIPEFLMTGSALTGGQELPDTDPTDPSQSVTVVPGRNLVMLSLAVSLAATHGPYRGRVLFGANADDAAVYPDCRKEFIDAVDNAAWVGYKIAVVAPFWRMTKKEVVRIGKDLDVPFDMTWSCYAGGESPCGKCGACRVRDGAMG